jgi:hypothetical protein
MSIDLWPFTDRRRFGPVITTGIEPLKFYSSAYDMPLGLTLAVSYGIHFRE